jgi:hypothetical protein
MERLWSMTEDGWQVCVNPFRMLGCLLAIGKASDRKLLLFRAASSRRVWDDLSDAERDAIEAAERYAEGEATWKDLQRIAFAKRGPLHWDKDPLVNFVAAVAATAVNKAMKDVYRRVWDSFEIGGGYRERQQIAKDLGLSDYSANDPREAWVEVDCRESKAQEDIIGDVFANPFYADPTIDPSRLVRTSGAIPRLTESIYNERDFDRMPELADAFEVSGCTDSLLLGHLRGPGSHFRGCWVLDLILKKRTIPRP